MTETDKAIRLSKAAKEFNTSTDHILDFLGKKNFTIERNPNAKLPGEAYALLLKEFSGDKSAKEEAHLVTLNKQKKDAATVLEADLKAKPVARKEEESPEILIKNAGTASEPAPEKPKTKKVAEPEVIKAKAEDLKGPKLKGKIDLEEVKEKPKTSKKKTEAEAPPVTSEEEKPKTKKKKTEEKSEEKIKEEVVAPVADEKIVTPVAETPPPADPVKEKDPDQPDTIRMQVKKLTGPTVLGKIELPVDPPKRKPVASSSDQDIHRKKRKRKEKPGEANNQQQQGQRPPFDPNRQRQGGPQRPGGGPPRPGQQGGNRFNRPATPKAEPTEKEIQDQIKATLARLSSGGKSKASKRNREVRKAAEREREELIANESEKKVIKVTEFVSANELSKLLNVPVTNIISTCMSLGMFVSINQRLDAETLSVVSEEFGYTVEFVSADVQESIKADEDKPEDLLPRAPIVTVMGHVDHGKTSLLDYVRKANVIAGEAGGITQHIGAYEVTLENGKSITFLDTPGHEAFTAMRARGAKITDVAIIVISADDSVMPQTVEAINHAQAAGVPIVFALNKMDKPDSNPDRIKEQLSKMNILVEDWGGKFQSQPVSAKKGTNVDVLLEKVLLEAEILDLKANPNRNANGSVIESSLDKGRGYITTILVQGGTLRVGDVLVAGCHYGRVKALFNERGQRVKEAGPSQPVLVLGMQGAPQAGDVFHVMDDEREAREIATKRLQLQREQGIRTHKHITLDEIGRRLAIGNFKELNVIVKGDVDGSIEALADSLLKLSNQEIQINVIHKSVGQITESDVLLASASDAIIVGFQVRPSANARKLAEKEEIDIRLYSIIYDAINELKAAIEGMLAPEFQEKITGNIEIREIFKIPKVGTIAGCMVLDGKVTRNTKVRVVRQGIVVYAGDLASLKRFKDDVKEVSAGFECGLSLHNYNNIEVGDIIEGYEQVAVKRTLASI